MGRGWAQFPLEGTGGFCWEKWALHEGEVIAELVIVGTNWISETGRESFTFQKQWADGQEPGRWPLDEGSGFKGERRTAGLCFKEIKSASYSCPEQTPSGSHPQHFGPPPSHSGIATHSHVSLVVGADFLDSDVVLGVNERLGGGIGFCHGYYAGHIPEVVLVLNFDLDCQNPVKKWQEQEKWEYFVSWSNLYTWTTRCQLNPT